MYAGIGGSGRQSATKLATFMADYDLFQIEITKGYGVNEWRDDLKRVKTASYLILYSILINMKIMKIDFLVALYFMSDGNCDLLNILVRF